MLDLVLLLGLLALAQEPAADAAAPELLPHEELVVRLRAVGNRPDSQFIGIMPEQSSRGGRELWALQLGLPSGSDTPDARPAILLVANLDGPEVFSSGVALWICEELTRRMDAGDEGVRSFLTSTTLYVVLRGNPDAAEARFRAPLAEVNATGAGVDDDRDGRAGENGPADVSGDGLITWMRVPDADGTWIEDPTDPRATVEADRSRGQVGKWRLVREGLDTDGDEEASEDPEHDTWLNRNFAHDWQEHEPSAGLFPMDEPEARALAEFMLLHDDIALVVTYGQLDNLVEAPKGVKPGSGRVPPSGVLEDDAPLIAELGRRYADIVETKVKGRGQVEGSFQAWAYHHRGLFSLEIALWDIPLDAKPAEELEDTTTGTEDPDSGDAGEAPEAPAAAETVEDDLDAPSEPEEEQDEPEKDDAKPSDEAKRLVWIDAEGEDARFVPWTPFEHPQLGPVEVGGFAPYARTEPPAAVGAEIVAQQLEFLISLGDVLPRARLVDCEARELGGGLVEVEANVQLDSLLPLRSAAARRARTVRPARVMLLVPEDAEIVAGRSVTLVSDLDGSGARHPLRWLVHGAAPDSIGIKLTTDHAGMDRCVPEVK